MDNRLSLVDELILSEVEQRGTVSNLAALARDKFVDYRNAHRRVTLLQAAGLVQTERLPNPRGWALRVTRGAKWAYQLRFEWPLAGANGHKERSGD